MSRPKRVFNKAVSREPLERSTSMLFGRSGDARPNRQGHRGGAAIARDHAVMMADRLATLFDHVAGLTPDGVDFRKCVKTPVGDFRHFLREALRDRK